MIYQFLKQSNRWKHLICGIIIGFGADDLYCAAYAGIGVAAAVELKDKLWGGDIDVIDFGVTVVGVAIGFGFRLLIF